MLNRDLIPFSILIHIAKTRKSRLAVLFSIQKVLSRFDKVRDFEKFCITDYRKGSYGVPIMPSSFPSHELYISTFPNISLPAVKIAVAFIVSFITMGTNTNQIFWIYRFRKS